MRRISTCTKHAAFAHSVVSGFCQAMVGEHPYVRNIRRGICIAPSCSYQGARHGANRDFQGMSGSAEIVPCGTLLGQGKSVRLVPNLQSHGAVLRIH